MSVYIGVGRFIILGEGGQGLEYWGRGRQGGAKLINQCQIITFLILKSNIKSDIERNSFASTFKLNLSYIYYYFTLQLGIFVIFSCFT